MAVTKPNVGDKVTTPYYDDFFTRLETFRQKAYAANPNTAYATAFTADTALKQNHTTDASTPQLIQSYVKKLENSKYIVTGLSDELNIPGVATLLDLADYPEKTEQIITALEATCFDNSQNHSGFLATNNGGFQSTNNTGFDSVDSNCDNCFWEQTFNGFSGRSC